MDRLGTPKSGCGRIGSIGDTFGSWGLRTTFFALGQSGPRFGILLGFAPRRGLHQMNSALADCMQKARVGFRTDPLVLLGALEIGILGTSGCSDNHMG